MSTLPTYAQVLDLPASFDQTVTDEFIDDNGHMNITDYFRLGSWAPWVRLGELGMQDDYISARGRSFFTVEHNIRYVAELRLGERFSVHAGFVGRTTKALHAVGIVADRERERIACVMEVMYVHISMGDRRAAPIPDDLAAAIDVEVAAGSGGWLETGDHALTLRR